MLRISQLSENRKKQAAMKNVTPPMINVHQIGEGIPRTGDGGSIGVGVGTGGSASAIAMSCDSSAAGCGC